MKNHGYIVVMSILLIIVVGAVIVSNGFNYYKTLKEMNIIEYTPPKIIEKHDNSLFYDRTYFVDLENFGANGTVLYVFEITNEYGSTLEKTLYWRIRLDKGNRTTAKFRINERRDNIRIGEPSMIKEPDQIELNLLDSLHQYLSQITSIVHISPV